ncbi:hypothetical protein BJX68DRAFT_226034 [Aspergillus pseudodeflectus]|uniref:Uncharacterized protein n=1 Tax=Aspergillus pseudodeflectus TaxID=176178 RepID=A0ABR4L6Z2_9EURO
MASFDLGENHETKTYINMVALLCADCQNKRRRATELQFGVIIGLHQKALVILHSDTDRARNGFRSAYIDEWICKGTRHISEALCICRKGLLSD